MPDVSKPVIRERPVLGRLSPFRLRARSSSIGHFRRDSTTSRNRDRGLPCLMARTAPSPA
jgi:hypothetical protein